MRVFRKKEHLLDIEKFVNKEYENLDTNSASYFDTFTIFPKKGSAIIKDLKSLEPFGKNNPEPIFYFKILNQLNLKLLISGMFKIS